MHTALEFIFKSDPETYWVRIKFWRSQWL